MKIQAKALCNKMLMDYRAVSKLQQEHPNRFLLIKFEELAQNSSLATDKIYQFIGEHVPGQVRSWFAEAEQGFDPMKAANAWQEADKGLDKALLQEIEEICQDVLTESHYHASIKR